MNSFSKDNIRSTFGGGKTSVNPTSVGIEVEAEYGQIGHISDDTLRELDSAGVYITTDGSLRNGVEFITRPIPEDKIKDNISTQIIGKALKEMKAMENSPRTSTHIHLSMYDKTFVQVVNFAVTYWSLEQVLVRLCKEYRHGNMFALTITDSHTILDTITDAFSRGVKPRYSENEFKYSSFNFTPLHKLGTCEIRLMHGLTDEKSIEDWALLCAAIRKLSLKFETPSCILNYGSINLYTDFLSYLDKDNVWKKELLKIKPDFFLGLSEEVLSVWSVGKTKEYWLSPPNSGRKGIVKSDSANIQPETDFNFEEQNWTPVELEGDI